MVLHVQTLSHVQVVPLIVRVARRVIFPPGLGLPTVIVSHVHAVSAGSAEPRGMRIVLHVHTRSHVQTPPACVDVFFA